MGKIKIGARTQIGHGKDEDKIESVKKHQVLTGKITKTKKKKPVKEDKAKFVKLLEQTSKELSLPLKCKVDGKSIKKEFKKKKDRVKAIRKTFQENVESIKMMSQKASKALRRQETPVVGDLNPLLEALEESSKAQENSANIKKELKLKRLQSTSINPQFRNNKKKNKNKSKNQQNDIALGLKYFQERLQGKK